ncbi:MAG: sugar phosphate isomerase/epimerase [Acidobacteria bacterium]|nr:sugar phosphate isomerase/epimerase [Acidobacteriota bacterium]
MRLAACNEMFEGWPFSRVCRTLAGLGYDGVELAPFTFAPAIGGWSRDARAAARRIASDAGLEVVGLHWLLARTEGLHLTSPDPDARARTSAYLIDLAHACHDLGGTVMVFGSPAQRQRLPGVSHDAAMDYAVETFRAAMPAIGDLGVRICMEPLSPDETNFVNTCADAIDLIDAVDHPQFVLQLDVKAMASETVPVAELIRRHAGRAGHVHANDPNRRGPGFGDEDFAPILRALDERHYRGWISVEVFDYTPDPETIARRSLEYLRQCHRAVETTR